MENVKKNETIEKSILFDWESSEWEKDFYRNEFFIRMVMSYMEDVRKARGFVLFGEILERFRVKVNPMDFRYGWEEKSVDYEYRLLDTNAILIDFLNVKEF